MMSVINSVLNHRVELSAYFVTFTDDKTRYAWVHMIKGKSDAFRIFSDWKVEVEKSLEQNLKIITDGSLPIPSLVNRFNADFLTTVGNNR